MRRDASATELSPMEETGEGRATQKVRGEQNELCMTV